MNTFDPMVISLRPALTLLRQDWIHKFFFETPQVERLAQLNYAINNPITMTGRLSVSSTSDVAVNTEADFLFAPSFSTGGLTVGFDITDRRTSTSTPKTGRSLACCVRDDDEGIFLSVTEHQSVGYTELALCLKFTPGFKCLVFTILKTTAFRSVVERGFNEDVVRQNILHIFCSLDIRSCPSCGSSSFMNCFCRLSLSRKKHPSDFDSEIRNFDSFVGAFDGCASLRVSDGRMVSVGDCVSVVNASVIGDTKWKEDIRKWAMLECAHGCSMNVVKLAMPDADSELNSEELVLREAVSNACSGTDGDISLEGVSAGVGGVSSDDEILRMFSGLSRFDASSDDISACGMMGLIFGQNGSQHTTDVTFSEKLTSCDEVTDRAAHGEVTEKPEESEPQNESQIRSERESFVQQTSKTTEFQVGLNRTTAKSSMKNRKLPNVTDHVRVNADCRARRPVSIAPAAGFPSERTSTFTAALQRKAELRKARNRASALRSNEKKRLYLKQLKDDIAATRKMEASLREKERSLREENIELRISVHRKGL